MGWGRRRRGLACISLFAASLLALAAALLLPGRSRNAPRDDRHLHALEAFDRGDFDRALSILGPLDDDRSHRLAARAATASDRPLLAIDHLLRIDNRDYRDTLDLASAYSAAGMKDLALASYESATRLRPDDPVPWKAAGLLYAERGDVALATSFLLRAYEFDPDDKELLIQVADLGRLERCKIQVDGTDVLVTGLLGAEPSAPGWFRTTAHEVVVEFAPLTGQVVRILMGEGTSAQPKTMRVNEIAASGQRPPWPRGLREPGVLR